MVNRGGQIWLTRLLAWYRSYGKKLVARRARRGLVYIIALLILVSAMFPLIFTISTSLMSSAQSFSLPPKVFPDAIYLENWEKLIQNFTTPGNPWLNWYKNSIILTGINIIGQISFAAITAFGFARFRFRLRKFMFLLLMSTLFLPPIARLLPQYMMFNTLHWTNTYLPLTIPTWFGGAFLTFLFYQFFVTIPRSLDESAKLDGASQFDIFFRVILPLSKPILATAFILTFASNWNSFFEPYVYLHDAEKYPLSIILGGMRSGSAVLAPGHAAMALFYAFPAILIFLVLQKNFIQGIQLSIAKD